MPKLGNETPVYMRNMGMKYRAEYDANNYVIYEGWTMSMGAGESDLSWQIIKHTWSSGNMTESNWANKSDDFRFAWSLRATYTYE